MELEVDEMVEVEEETKEEKIRRYESEVFFFVVIIYKLKLILLSK
jgi:hypothetical protein